jgi:hypothetical protein
MHVLGCSIAFVATEPILWVFGVEIVEETIAFDLGEDGSSGNGTGEGVALNDGFLRDGEVDADSVNEQEVRWWIECEDSSFHGEATGLEDVDMEDLFNAGKGDGPGDCFPLETLCQLFALFRSNDFGIAKALDFARVWKDYSGSGYRPKQTSPADFIDAGRRGKSAGPQAGFFSQ